MGEDLIQTAEAAIRDALEAISAATAAVEQLPDHEVVESVSRGLDAATFSLRESARRLGR